MDNAGPLRSISSVSMRSIMHAFSRRAVTRADRKPFAFTRSCNRGNKTISLRIHVVYRWTLLLIASFEAPRKSLAVLAFNREISARFVSAVSTRARVWLASNLAMHHHWSQSLRTGRLYAHTFLVFESGTMPSSRRSSSTRLCAICWR